MPSYPKVMGPFTAWWSQWCFFEARPFKGAKTFLELKCKHSCFAWTVTIQIIRSSRKIGPIYHQNKVTFRLYLLLCSVPNAIVSLILGSSKFLLAIFRWAIHYCSVNFCFGLFSQHPSSAVAAAPCSASVFSSVEWVSSSRFDLSTSKLGRCGLIASTIAYY